MISVTSRSATGRERAADVLLLLATAAIALASCALYIEANIFDSARFADRAQTALQQPNVRALVVDDIGDLIVSEVSSDAVAVRPLIDTVSGAVIDTAAFQRLFRTAALQLHEAAVEGDVDNAVLTVANIGIVISQGLREIVPEIGEQIPESFDEALLEVANFESIEALTDAAKLSHDLANYLSLLALLLVAAAFIVSKRRVRTLGRLGLSLIFAGALIVAIYYLVRFFTLGSAVEAGTIGRTAAEELWNSFMEDLVEVAIFMIGAGAILSVVVDAALGGERVQDRARRLLDLSGAPHRTGARIVWAVAMIAAGLWLAFEPLSAVETIVSLLGILAVAVGMQELALLASPPVEATDSAAAELVRQRRRTLRVVVYVMTAGIFSAAIIGAIHVGGGIESLGLTRTADDCNGSKELCAKPLNEVAFATTHNSMAAASEPNWLFPAQEDSIATQLGAGIHGLMLDVYYAFPGRRAYTDTERSSPKARSVMLDEFGEQFVDSADRIRRSISEPEGVDPELYMCHGFCELGATKLAEAIDALRDYMKKNPREVAIVIFEEYVPWRDLAGALERGGLREFAYDGPWGGEWPTLGEMIDDGGRLVLLTEKAEPGVSWMHNAFDVVQETPFRFETIDELRSPRSCDESRGDSDGSVFLVNHWVDTPPNPRPSIARRVNRDGFLSERIERCEKRRELPAGPVAVDFYREGDLLSVVDRINSERR